MFARSIRVSLFFAASTVFSSLHAQGLTWRSEGTFDASTVPQSAVNTFVDASIGGIPITGVDFAHSIAVIEGGVLQLNDGAFTISAANGDSLLGEYTDFRYSPNPDPATDFAGLGDYTFTGGTGIFNGATGSGAWEAQAEFFPGSETMGTANHNWTSNLALVRTPEVFEWRSVGTFDASTVPQSAVNTFEGTTIGGVEIEHVDFAHSISVLDGGILQLNDGAFTIAAANGDTLLGTYTDFQYAPNPAPAMDFTGRGNYVFTGGTGIFEGAIGAGSWVAEAEFFVGSETMGIANHNWSGGLLLANHSTISAEPAGNLYLETFEDSDPTDGSPLHWQLLPGFDQGKVSVVDGDLVVTQTGGHSLVPFAAAPAPADISLRAVLRTEDYMTIVARADTTTGTAYGGGIRSDGSLHIERTHPGTGEAVTTFLATETTDLRPAEEDVFLQFDLFGDKLDVYAWRVGDSKPSTPSVSVTDSTHSNPGPFGFIKCCGNETSTIQSVQVSSSPIGDLTGDFDNSNTLSAADIDLLSSAIGSQDTMFDVNLDGVVDLQDHTMWINKVAGIPFGDINFDGTVTFPDYLALSAGFGKEGGWASGDLNGDGTVRFSDFLILSANFGSTSQGIASVPEPDGCVLSALGLICASTWRRPRRLGRSLSI